MTTAASTKRRRAVPPDWRTKFLKELERSGLVSKATAAAGVSRTTVYNERSQNTDFKRAWKAAWAKSGRQNKRGPIARPWHADFLRHLRDTGKVSAAITLSRISRTNVYAARNTHDDFRQAWDQALTANRGLHLVGA